jgi:hypothetical protein
MVCKLAQIPPEIWMTLPLEAKKWLLNERKCQQQEDNKMKKSLALSKSTAVTNDKESNNSNMHPYMNFFITPGWNVTRNLNLFCLSMVV